VIASRHAEVELRGPESWVSPLSLDEFRRVHWARSPLVIRGTQARVEPLIGQLGVQLGSLPTNAEGIARIKLSEGSRYATLEVSFAEAAKALAFGKTVNIVRPFCTRGLEAEYVREFSLPADRVAANLYFSKAGGMTPMHLDASEQLIIQLLGTKVWRLAPSDVVHPLEHALLGERPDPSLRMHYHGAWPAREPTESFDFEAVPGSVVFVPRGTWHATRTTEESVSVHLQYRALSWLEVLAPLMERELAREPMWRADACAAQDERELADRMSRALVSAAERLRSLHVEDLLGRWPEDGGGARYRRRAAVGVGLEGVDEEGQATYRMIAPDRHGDRIAECAVAPELVDIVQWVAERGLAERFGPEDVPGKQGVSHEDVVELFATLMEAGLIAPSI
jgi:50S ribosomal protein L16 3-hydroxylase